MRERYRTDRLARARRAPGSARRAPAGHAATERGRRGARPAARRPPRRARPGPCRVARRPAARGARRADRRRQEHGLQHDRRPAASETGVLRPTTRVAVVLVHPGRPRGARRRARSPRSRRDSSGSSRTTRSSPGSSLVDAPDIDSVEHANRELADRLVEAADLAVFVTTATRYADRVPWAVLDRVRERGLPLQVIVNRMPPDADDRAEVLADVRRCSRRPAWTASRRRRRTPRHASSSPSRRARSTPTATGSSRRPIAPVLDEIARLRADREARRRARRPGADRLADRARREPRPDRRRRRARGDRRRGAAAHRRPRLRGGARRAAAGDRARARSCARRRCATGRRSSARTR